MKRFTEFTLAVWWRNWNNTRFHGLLKIVTLSGQCVIGLGYNRTTFHTLAEVTTGRRTNSAHLYLNIKVADDWLNILWFFCVVTCSTTLLGGGTFQTVKSCISDWLPKQRSAHVSYNDLLLVVTSLSLANVFLRHVGLCRGETLGGVLLADDWRCTGSGLVGTWLPARGRVLLRSADDVMASVRRVDCVLTALPPPRLDVSLGA